MKFDVIIGNPPYNDGNESAVKDKHNKKTQGTATYYKYFIQQAFDLLKETGKVAFILPPGAHKYFYSSRFNLDRVHFVDGHCWPKTLVTRLWFASKSLLLLPEITPVIFSKIIDWKQFISHGDSKGGICTYNFTISTFTQSEEKVYKRSYVDSLSKEEQAKSNIKWNLYETDTNLANLRTLLKFFHKYLHFFGYQWHSWNNTMDYQWLEGRKTLITEQDIIDHYGLTADEVNTIKNG